jgi:uncharacterized protein YecE (DUF72 family)
VNVPARPPETPQPIRVGCAAWSIPSDLREAFPAGGSQLERYAQRLDTTEVNTTFYRPHRAATWERWAASVPAGFRFAVKLPRAITHEARLVAAEPLVDAFLGDLDPIAGRLGPLLVQLPPSLELDVAVAATFLAALRERTAADVACEPRHESWFTPEAGRLLADHRVTRVAADPARVPEAGEPGGFDGLAYVRLHGTPAMYRSSYDEQALTALARSLRELAATRPVWCIFDNTQRGAAVPNALRLLELVSPS